jgi:hypothetical protein
MKRQFGLNPRYINEILKLPEPQRVKVFETDKILNSRKKMSITEKLEHLEDLKDTLETRIKMIE